MYITLTETQSLSHDALLHAGASPDQASAVALSIRAAEAEGTRGIGLGYLPWYWMQMAAPPTTPALDCRDPSHLRAGTRDRHLP